MTSGRSLAASRGRARSGSAGLFEIARHEGVEGAGAGVGKDEEGVEEDVLDGFALGDRRPL
jgi:hypothetical protein